jgi:Lar family restriction alleviation protein
MTDTLEPCPYCGYDSQTTDNYRNFIGKLMWFVRCQTSNCFASGPEAKTEAEAVAAWNHRAILAPVLALLNEEHDMRIRLEEELKNLKARLSNEISELEVIDWFAQAEDE